MSSKRMEPAPTGEKSSRSSRGIIGRDYREEPPFRPILDSNVELFEPQSREPVRVKNAFSQMLLRQFTVPILLFVLSIVAVYGIYVFVVDLEEESQAPKIAADAGNNGAATTSRGDTLERAMRRGSNPVSTFGVESVPTLNVIPPAPAQVSYCRAAENLVTNFLNAESLEQKLKFLVQPEKVQRDFLTRYPAVKVGKINHRRLKCVGLAPNAVHETYLVEVTLYNFSSRIYRVRHEDGDMEIALDSPEALLN